MAVDRPPVADHLPHPHRRTARRNKQDTRERARLAARRGGGPPDQGALRLADRAAVLRAGGGARALPRDDRRAASELEREWDERFAAYRAEHPRAGRRARGDLRAPRADAAGGPAQALRARRRRSPRARPPQEVLQVAAELVPCARRRLGRPRALDADADRRRRRRRARALRRAQPPLRDPRARAWARSSTASR